MGREVSDTRHVERFAEILDRIILTTFEPGKVERNGKLYEILRRRSGRPLTLHAAEGLVNNVTKGSCVVIVTGSVTREPVMVMPRGETCGPVGAASLARSLNVGLNVKPLIVCEEVLVPGLEVACEAAGLQALSYDDFTRAPRAVHVMGFPTHPAESRAKAQRLLDDANPTAIVAMSKHGANTVGEYHTWSGFTTTASRIKASLLFDAARERGIFTLGLTDGANKIGFGSVFEDVVKLVPRRAQERSKGGVVSVTPTDATVLAGCCANPAAWGVEACLALLLENPDVLHDVETERRILRRAVHDGRMMDAGSGMLIYGCDGTPEDAYLAVFQLVRTATDYFFPSRAPRRGATAIEIFITQPSAEEE
jgi:hypothetical protein